MRYTKLTPEKQFLKARITEILAADGHYATYKAVSDFLRVHWRGLMRAKHDPRNELNARIVHRASTADLPPGAVVWLPGRQFSVHIAARLRTVLDQQARTGSSPPGSGSGG